jgi:hypothetical protein
MAALARCRWQYRRYRRDRFARRAGRVYHRCIDNAALVNFTAATADIGVNEGVRLNAVNPDRLQQTVSPAI